LKEHGIDVKFTANGKFEKSFVALNALIYKTVRELMLNILKHSKARKAHVSLRRRGGLMSVIVRDDGVGFDAEAHDTHSLKKRSFGLFSIRERMKYLGGSMEVISTPRKGAEVRLKIPYAKRGAQ
jgi:signal transduction histidine kinase